ncbi:DHH family protein [uncultured archaeon]|nr:DHH family protein [uncultured archaeon]
MEYLVGNKKIFLDYLNNLGKKDRIGVISHADLDGVASAILINEILKQKKLEVKGLEFINYRKGIFEKSTEIFSRKRINKIFLCDVGIDPGEEFEELRKQFDVFYIDHHPSEIKGNNIIKAKTADCATFLIYETAKNDFDLSKLEWLVCTAMVSDFSFKDSYNFNFLKEHYPEIKLESIMDSEPGEMSKKISSALIYFKGKEKKVFDLVLKGKLKQIGKYQERVDEEINTLVEKFKKEAEFYPEKNLYLYQTHPKFSVTSALTTILSMQEPEKTFVFISDIDGEPDFYKVSSRHQAGKEDMNLLMKKGIEGMENATAGGHVPAAAARFLKKDLKKFKENLFGK